MAVANDSISETCLIRASVADFLILFNFSSAFLVAGIARFFGKR